VASEGVISRVSAPHPKGELMLRHCFVLLAIAVVLSSCARPKSGDELNLDSASTLNVVNHHWGDVDVYAVRDGQRQRVGTVTAAAEQNFELSPSLTKGAGTLQFQAHAVGSSGGINSETINVRPGGMQITWTLESNLSRATLAVY
jgi:hypothetical protein